MDSEYPMSAKEAKELMLRGTNVAAGQVAYSNNTTLLAAILRVMHKVGYVQKSGENEFHHYKYATESDTIAALRPVMLDEGLILMPSMMHSPVLDQHGNTHIMMSYTLYHVPTGERMVINVPGSGNDRSSKGTVGDKGVYKAMTGALKYALRQTFMLETGEDPERGNNVDDDATEETENVANLLRTADTLIKLAGECDHLDQLQSVWTNSITAIELLRHEHKELWTKVRDAFAARKRVVTPHTQTQGGQS